MQLSFSFHFPHLCPSLHSFLLSLDSFFPSRTHTHKHTHPHTHTRIHKHTHAYTHTHKQTHTQTHTHTHTQTHTNTHTMCVHQVGPRRSPRNSEAAAAAAATSAMGKRHASQAPTPQSSTSATGAAAAAVWSSKQLQSARPHSAGGAESDECFVTPTANGTALVSADGQPELCVSWGKGECVYRCAPVCVCVFVSVCVSVCVCVFVSALPHVTHPGAVVYLRASAAAGLSTLRTTCRR